MSLILKVKKSLHPSVYSTASCLQMALFMSVVCMHGNQNGELPHDCMVKTGMHKPYPGCVRGEESLINGEKSLDNFSLFRKDIAGVNV